MICRLVMHYSLRTWTTASSIRLLIVMVNFMVRTRRYVACFSSGRSSSGHNWYWCLHRRSHRDRMMHGHCRRLVLLLLLLLSMLPSHTAHSVRQLSTDHRLKGHRSGWVWLLLLMWRWHRLRRLANVHAGWGWWWRMHMGRCHGQRFRQTRTVDAPVGVVRWARWFASVLWLMWRWWNLHRQMRCHPAGRLMFHATRMMVPCAVQSICMMLARDTVGWQVG